MRCAVINISDNICQNIIMASPSDQAPEGAYLIEIINGMTPNIGWAYDPESMTFINPNPPRVIVDND